MKWHKYMTLKDESPRSESIQYAIGEEWRAITDSSRKNEATGPKQKLHSVVDMPGAESKVRCYKEQCCIGTWNVRSMNQGKLKVVKQEMARVIVDILGISEKNGLEKLNLTQMTIISTTAGRNPSEEMEWPSWSTKEAEMQYLDAISKTTE